MLLCPSAGAGPSLVMPAGAAARGPATAPGKGPTVPGWAVLAVLVLSALWQCGAVPPPELGQHRGAQWVWGAPGEAQAEPPLLSRRKRDDSGQQPGATAVPGAIGTDSAEPHLLLSSATPAAPGTNSSLHWTRAVPTTAEPLDETDAPDLLPSSAPPPSTNASLHQARAVPTTAEPLDETDAPELLLSSATPAARGTNASLLRAHAVPTTAELPDETDAPDLLPSSAPPLSTNASLHRARAVPTTAEPLDETDAPELLMDPTTAAEPSTQAAAKHSITTTPSRLTALGEEVASGTDSSSAVGPHSATSPPLGPTTTTGYKKVKKAGASPAPTRSPPWETTPRGTTAAPVPWDPSGLMGRCLLAILLLALVAATFMVCTGVLGARLWRRARTARRRLSNTEMVCISSLLPDGDVATNGPRSGPARRQKLLLDGGSELDGDNLTLRSFLPEHS